MKELPVRKSIRLKNYDYSSAGYYFVTVCVEGRHEMLSKIVGSDFYVRPRIELTDIGIEIQKSIEYITANNAAVEIPKYIIMPNHVHLIIVLKSVECIRKRGRAWKPDPTIGDWANKIIHGEAF